MRRPSFVVFVTDQQRADHLGVHGRHPLSTPAIDAIAARGIRLERHYVAMPICMPNRATLLTGRMPSRHGVRHNGIELPLHNVTVPELLADAGWRTALVGKAHLQNFTPVPPQYGADPPPAGAREPSPALRSARRDTDDLAGHGQEDAERWADPSFRMRLPYYGFDTVDLVTRHGDRCGGDYLRWALAQAPDFARLTGPQAALPAPGYTTREGWRTRVPEALYPTTYVEQRTIERLREFARTPDVPFFLVCSFPDPHHPWTPPGRYWDRYRPDDVELPAAYWNGPARTGHPALDAYRDQRDAATRTPHGAGPIPVRGAYACDAREAREAIALTWGMIAMIDDAVGRIDRTLVELGLDRDTVVAFTSDHGDYMGDHQMLLKSSLHFDGVVRTPFLWADPALGSQAGTSRSRLTGAVDVARTILGRAGVAPADGMQGVALGPLFDDAGAPTRDALLIEDEDHRTPAWRAGRGRVRTLVTDRHRLSLYGGTGWGELYDLHDDPHELVNLWDDPGAAGLRSSMLERLAREMMDTDEVLPRPTRFA